jgi:hypothetical protein
MAHPRPQNLIVHRQLADPLHRGRKFLVQRIALAFPKRPINPR